MCNVIIENTKIYFLKNTGVCIFLLLVGWGKNMTIYYEKNREYKGEEVEKLRNKGTFSLYFGGKYHFLKKGRDKMIIFWAIYTPLQKYLGRAFFSFPVKLYFEALQLGALGVEVYNLSLLLVDRLLEAGQGRLVAQPSLLSRLHLKYLFCERKNKRSSLFSSWE